VSINTPKSLVFANLIAPVALADFLILKKVIFKQKQNGSVLHCADQLHLSNDQGRPVG